MQSGQALKGLTKAAAKQPAVKKGQKAAVHGGSVAVGLVAYAIGLNYLQHGWPGVTAWLKAKLMNKTAQDGNGIPAEFFTHNDAMRTAAASGATYKTPPTTSPAHPVAPTPSGGTIYV